MYFVQGDHIFSASNVLCRYIKDYNETRTNREKLAHLKLIFSFDMLCAGKYLLLVDTLNISQTITYYKNLKEFLEL